MDNSIAGRYGSLSPVVTGLYRHIAAVGFTDIRTDNAAFTERKLARRSKAGRLSSARRDACALERHQGMSGAAVCCAVGALWPIGSFRALAGPITFDLLLRPFAEELLAFDLPVEDSVVQLAEVWLAGMRADQPPQEAGT